MLGGVLAFCRLVRSRRSIASMEFALVLPFMVLLMAGVYDVSEALIIYTEVYEAAHVIPASASVLAVQGDGSTALTYDEIQFAESEIWGDIPALRNGYKISSSTAVTLTSVQFQPNGNNGCASTLPASTYNGSSYYYNSATCIYTAYAAWSVAYTALGITSGSTFQQYVRPCVGVAADNFGLHQVASGTYIALPAATPSVPANNGDTFLDTIPTLTTSSANAGYKLETGPSPILVADVEFTFKPTFKVFFPGGSLNYWATGLWPVRSVKSANPYYIPSLPVASGTSVLVDEPLSQQYTTIYGSVSNGAVTLYGATGVSNDPPAQTGNLNGSAYSAAWCVNTNLNTPFPFPLTTPPTNGEL
jgi:hypothetical protein